MAALICNSLKPLCNPLLTRNVDLLKCGLHTTSVACRVQSGKYRITPKRNRPLTYEMANPPYFIFHRKNWNSFNTTNLDGGLRRSETAVEDMFIRKFITGAWHGMVMTEIIIKRQFNHIRIAAIMRQALLPTKMYFLIGFSEELLSNWLQCPVTMEIQTVEKKEDVIFKYI